MRSHYDVLEISKNASPETVHDAYRSLAFKNHPDRNQNSPEATRNFQEILAAYKVLSDDIERRKYDKSLAKTVNGMSFSVADDAEEIIDKTAIALRPNYNLAQMLTTAKMSGGEIVSFCINNEAACLDLLDNKNLIAKLCSYYLINLGSRYESVALKIIHSKLVVEEMDEADQTIIDLANTHWSVCKSLFESNSLVKNITGEQIKKLISKYGAEAENLCKANPETHRIWSAYQEIQLYKNDGSRIVDDTTALSQQLVSAGISSSQQHEIARANASFSAALECKEIQEIHENVYDYKHEAFQNENRAIVELNNPKFIAFLKVQTYHISTLLNLSVTVCLAVLKTSTLLTHIDPHEIRNAILKYGDPILNHVTSDHFLQEKYQAYCELLNLPENYHVEEVKQNIKIINSSHTIRALITNKNLAKAIIQIQLLFPDSNDYCIYILYATLTYPDIAEQVLNNPILCKKFIIFKDANTVCHHNLKNCSLVLENKKLSSFLLGSELYTLTKLYGKPISDIILANEILSQRLWAYCILDKAKSAGLQLEEKKALDLSDNNREETYFRMGMNYLKDKEKNALLIAAEYFYKAASLRHETAYLQLIKIADQVGDPYFYELGCMYFDKYNAYYDIKESESWFIKSAALGNIEAIQKVCVILNEITSYQLNIPFSSLACFIAIDDFLKTHELQAHLKDKISRSLISSASRFTQDDIVLKYLLLLSNPDANESFQIASLYLNVIADQQTQELIQTNNQIALSPQQIQLHLAKKTHVAKRLNLAIPFFIKAANLDPDNDLKETFLLKFLSELARTGLCDKVVATLFLSEYNIALKLSQEDVYAIIASQAELLTQENMALVAIKKIQQAEYLFQLGFKCNTTDTNKLHPITYLFWFKAAELGHDNALRLLQYLQRPVMLNLNSTAFEVFTIPKSAPVVRSLDENDGLNGLTESEYSKIVATLIYYMDNNANTHIPTSFAHCYTALGDLEAIMNMGALSDNKIITDSIIQAIFAKNYDFAINLLPYLDPALFIRSADEIIKRTNIGYSNNSFFKQQASQEFLSALSKQLDAYYDRWHLFVENFIKHLSTYPRTYLCYKHSEVSYLRQELVNLMPLFLRKHKLTICDFDTILVCSINEFARNLLNHQKPYLLKKLCVFLTTNTVFESVADLDFRDAILNKVYLTEVGRNALRV